MKFDPSDLRGSRWLACVPFWNGEAKKSLDDFASDQHALVGLPQPPDPAKKARQKVEPAY
jgi:hypothetical protein